MWSEINFSTTPFIVGLLHLGPAALFGYLGILRWSNVFPGCRKLTVWGLAGFLILDWLRRSFYWIAQGFNIDLIEFVGASDLIISINVSLILILLFIRDEKVETRRG